MSKVRQIRAVNYGNPIFQKTFRKLKPDVLKEAKRALSELILLDIDNAPAKLHLHALTNKQVLSALDQNKKVPVYSIHLTTNDTYKASFTYEEETAYMRICGEHDDVDKNL
ncbi:hypothetical protein [Collimonas antrihumi]|uniref:hypothetical protein n=1 Tax=Collimonas antrihumi TaxID=1940615 RepID=UPI001B8CB526|nr:hypothetical protein [Collimonas antrihumi]